MRIARCPIPAASCVHSREPTIKHPFDRRRASAAFTLALLAVAWPLFSQVPSLDDVLKRAREAVARYEQQAALLLANEQCEQKAFESSLEGTAGGGALAYRGNPIRVDPRGRRKWQAELAMVRTPDLAARGYPWMEFRDVVTVDGRPLADREQRLSRLFLQQAAWSLQRAREIAEESSRFNIGSVKRNVNTPAVPLLILHAVNAARFSFQKSGEEVIEKTKAWKVDYRERTAPTLISAGDAPCPASGTFWIDPVNGEVLRAVVECVDMQMPAFFNRITVTYRRDERLGMRLPVEMLERQEGNSGKVWYGQPGRLWVEGRCTYSNFRRFETAAKMIIPK